MPNKNLLKFNDLAPDLDVLDSEGRQIRLSSLWQAQPLVLAFTRHFGCPQCKEMMDELYQAQPQLAQKGLALAIVTQGSPEQAAAFCAARAPGAACLADPQRAVYAAYGLAHGSLWQTLLSPKIWISNQRVKREKGFSPEAPPAGQDVFVMSGTFIIGPDGRIRLPYYYEDIADHPSLDLLLHGLMGMDWGKPLEGAITPDE
ncbi:MAG: peroxiredoxin-like family protein [Anaerolineales bacterium]|jgi:peroxiredoxin|nr:peroxiredoxin-like family protein [Anaerolineales bacterium]